MKTIPIICLSAILSLHASLAADNGLLATIGKDDVKIDEMLRILEDLDGERKQSLKENPAMLNQIVRTLLIQRVVLGEAKAQGWDKSPEVQRNLERVRDAAIAESFLQSKAEPASEYPSEAELAEAYEAAKPNLLVPRQYRVAQIFIAAQEGKAKARLDAALADLAKPEADFAAVARLHSQDTQSNSRDGIIGWVAENQLQPEVKAALEELKKDEVSKPIQLADGWHIVKWMEKKEPYTASLAEVRDELRSQLRAARARENSEAYLATLLKDKPVSVNEIAVSQLLRAE